MQFITPSLYYIERENKYKIEEVKRCVDDIRRIVVGVFVMIVAATGQGNIRVHALLDQHLKASCKTDEALHNFLRKY